MTKYLRENTGEKITEEVFEEVLIGAEDKNDLLGIFFIHNNEKLKVTLDSKNTSLGIAYNNREIDLYMDGYKWVNIPYSEIHIVKAITR